MKLKIAIAAFVMLLGLGTMAYAWGQIAGVEQVYSEGNAAYEELGYIVRGRASGGNAAQAGAGAAGFWYGEQYATAGAAPAEAGAGADGTGLSHGAGEVQVNGDGKLITMPDGRNAADDGTFTGSTSQPMDSSAQPGRANAAATEINFEALKALNSDAMAWLYCPGTAIDYPVMKSEDYSYYLHHLPNGRENANGALFIDFNNAPDFSGPLTVIYGHHMKSGGMFGSLTRYKEQQYYERHPVMLLYTEQGDYRIELLYGCVIGSEQWRERAFMYKENLESFIAYAEYNTTFDSGVGYTEGDKIVALSTCSYEFEDARFVVLGVLRDAG